MIEYNLIIKNKENTEDVLSLPVIVYDYDASKKNYETYPQKVNKKYKLRINHSRYALNTSTNITGVAYSQGILYSNDYDEGDWNNIGSGSNGGANYGGSGNSSGSGNSGGSSNISGTDNGISFTKNPIVIDIYTEGIQATVIVEGAKSTDDSEISVEIEDNSIVKSVNKFISTTTEPSKRSFWIESAQKVGTTNLIIRSKKDTSKVGTLVFKVVENLEDYVEEPSTGNKKITIKNSYIIMPYTGGNYDLKLEATTSWKVKECPDWIKLNDGDSGTSNTTLLKLSFDNYPGTNGDRMGYIVLESTTDPSITAKCLTIQEINETDDASISVIEGPENNQTINYKTGAKVKLSVTSSNSWFIDYDNWAMTLDTFIGGGNTEINGIIYRDTHPLSDTIFIRLYSLKNFLSKYDTEINYFCVKNLCKLIFPKFSHLSMPDLRNDDSTFNIVLVSFIDWKLENIPSWLSIIPYSGSAGIHILTCNTSNVTGTLNAEIRCVSNNGNYLTDPSTLYLSTNGVFKSNKDKYGYFNYTHIIFDKSEDIRTLKIFSNTSWVIITDVKAGDIEKNKEYMASLGWDNTGDGNKEIEVNIGNILNEYNIILYERIGNGNNYEVGNQLDSITVISINKFGDTSYYNDEFYKGYLNYPTLYTGEEADTDDGRDSYESIVETLSLDKYYTFVKREANTIELKVNTIYNWNADCPSWCSLDKYFGSGSDTIIISVSENTSLDERYDAIKVYVVTDDISLSSMSTFHIHQDSYITIDGQAPRLSITPESQSIPPFYYFGQFKVDTNLRRWSYKVEKNWLFDTATYLDGTYNRNFSNIKGTHNISISFSKNGHDTLEKIATLVVIPPTESGLSEARASVTQERNIYKYYVELTLVSPDLNGTIYSDEYFYNTGSDEVTVHASVKRKNRETGNIDTINYFGDTIFLKVTNLQKEKNKAITTEVGLRSSDRVEGQPAEFKMTIHRPMLYGNSTWKITQVSCQGVNDIPNETFITAGTISNKIVGILDTYSYGENLIITSDSVQLADVGYFDESVYIGSNTNKNVLGLDTVISGDRKKVLPNSSTPITWSYNITSGENTSQFIIFSKGYYLDSTLVIDKIEYGHLENPDGPKDEIYNKNTNSSLLSVFNTLKLTKTFYYNYTYEMKVYVLKNPQIFNGTLYITSHFE